MGFAHGPMGWHSPEAGGAQWEVEPTDSDPVASALTRAAVIILEAGAIVMEFFEWVRSEPIEYPKASPASCFDCGAPGLENFRMSKHLGYHLCPSCFAKRRERGLARES